jgi:hypothetical protein
VPQISSFYGIIIYLYFNDHNPPHFHAEYSGYEVLIEIRLLTVIKGSLPKRAMNLVVEWAQLHQNELLAAWEVIRNKELPNAIEPLP